MFIKAYKSIAFRWKFIILGTIIAAAALFGTDPDLGWIRVPFGADVIAKLSSLPAAVFAVMLLFICGKALHDYYDMEALYRKAAETPDGASRALISVAINRLALAILIIGMISLFAR